MTSPVVGPEKAEGGLDLTQQRIVSVVHAVLEVAKRLSRNHRGALFVIGDPQTLAGRYELHFPQLTTSETLFTRGMSRVLEALADLDGAILVTPDGRVIAYGARLLAQDTVPGFGTRHAAARGTTQSEPSLLAVLVSEETRWVKVFRRGDVILETDEFPIESTILARVAGFLVTGDARLLDPHDASLVIQTTEPSTVLRVGYAHIIVPHEVSPAPPVVDARGAP